MAVCTRCKLSDRLTSLGRHWRTLSVDGRTEVPHLAPPVLYDARYSPPVGLLVLGGGLLVTGSLLGLVVVAAGLVWLTAVRNSAFEAYRRYGEWKRKLICERCDLMVLP
ncbi:hypothetical protein [Streptomyces sp. NBC_01530]|uniref:hypothetical protein n=1 Tax=Streptomyces sp. NBC_01530 TaxID=2903895 RepID=UPI00386C4DEB